MTEHKGLRLGILGGTLDPVHNGHLAVARSVKAALGLDGVMLLPSGDPPHKQPPTMRADRLRMAELACEGEEGFFASDAEISREGVTYTIDTMIRLRVSRPDGITSWGPTRWTSWATGATLTGWRGFAPSSGSAARG